MKNINELEQELSNLLCPLHNKSSKITITELEDELSIKGEKSLDTDFQPENSKNPISKFL